MGPLTPTETEAIKVGADRRGLTREQFSEVMITWQQAPWAVERYLQDMMAEGAEVIRAGENDAASKVSRSR